MATIPRLRPLCRAVPFFIISIGALSDAVAQTPPAPVVTLSADTRRIELSWPVVPRASYYVVRESATAGAPFTAISARIAQGRPGEILTHAKTISVHCQDWQNARYRVDACDQAQIPFCNRSIEQSAAALELETIGYLRAAKTDAADGFGMAVGTSADGVTLAIGAPTANGLSIEAVYVFARSGNSWSRAARLTASNGGLGDRFGSPIALSADGRTLAVGANGEDSSGTGTAANGLDDDETESGATYIISRAPVGSSWTREAFIKPAVDAGVFFGGALYRGAIALSGDATTLVVPAADEDGPNDATPDSGVAYLY